MTSSRIGSRFRAAFARFYPGVARRRRWVALGVYSAITVAALAGAYLVRFEGAIPGVHMTTLIWAVALLVPIRGACHLTFRVATGRWRFASLNDVTRLVISSTVGSVVFLAITWGVVGVTPRIPLGVILIEWVLTTYLIAGIWVAYRLIFEWIRHGQEHGSRAVLIIGAGEAGDRLLRELRRSGSGAYRPVGFVDDDPIKLGASINGAEVLGPVSQLQEIARRSEADEILIAMPSAGPRQLRGIIEACQDTGLPHRVLPGIAAVLRGSVKLDQLRQVRIEDLLGRDPVKLELPELVEDLGGKVVLVTGAAGSIGSELCRQIALHNPRCLILFDQAESPLYFIDRELCDRHAALEIVPIVGDVRDPRDLQEVFQEWRPERVFHAAAYKHVPLMEVNVRKAVENNVLGTRNVVRAAAEGGVEKFVLISTDKAVRPSSVMGATKRVAELLVLEAAQQHPDTGWYAVRFGNVLGSAGSVIPLFQRQLGQGRSLTVTHEEVTRYFMTIPEAVQLVLQASLLDEGRGRIIMLDMGDPVKIMDLARDLIRLAGRIEGVDAEIEVTGLRPGEKMHEELSAPEEEVISTAIEKISVLVAQAKPRRLSQADLHALAAGGEDSGDAALRATLMRIVKAPPPPVSRSTQSISV